jgi:hypothetical protein
MILSEIRKLIDKHFNEEELRTLCFDLNMDYDGLPARGKTGKVRELIADCERKGLLDELLTKVRELRPNVQWPDLTSHSIHDDHNSVESKKKSIYKNSSQFFSQLLPAQKLSILIGGLILLGSIIWFVVDPDFEPLLLILGEILSLTALFKVRDRWAPIFSYGAISVFILGLLFIYRIFPDTVAELIAPSFAEPTLTQRPSLEAYNPNAVELSDLRDIIAKDGNVWIASSVGLLRYHEGTIEYINEVSVPLQAVAVDHNNSVVWFSFRDSNKVGNYGFNNNSVDFFEPSNDIGSLNNSILDILVASDNTVWFGDVNQGLIRYIPADISWEQIAPDNSIGVNLLGVQRLVAGKPEPTTLWLIGTTFVFRLQNNNWTAFHPDNTDNNLPLVVNAVLSDVYNRIWFANVDGITILENPDKSQPEWQWQQCRLDKIPGAILDLEISDEGQVIWIASEGGLARVDISQNPLPANCADWSWTWWPKVPETLDFWESNMEIRLGIEESPTHLTIWVLKRFSGSIMRLDWD